MRAKGWSGFRSVLCPVDFSEASRLALRYAAALAARGGARLTVDYANDPFLVAAASAALHDRTFVRRSAKELRHFIDATLPRHTQRALRLKTRISVGTAGDEILDGAMAAGSDVIVMGTHGLTGAGRLLMGSTTRFVLQRTKIPVLAIPLVAAASRSALSSWPRGRVVAAIDLDRHSRAEVQVFARVAQWLGTSLLLLHVVPETALPSWVNARIAAHDRDRLARAERDLETLAAMARRRVETAVRVALGRPEDEIAALVSREKPQLLMTALRDRNGWFGAGRGSVSYGVLSHGVVPVLACPRRWRPR